MEQKSTEILFHTQHALIFKIVAHKIFPLVQVKITVICHLSELYW